MNTFWKRFAAWATDLHNKYWYDIFFRTEFNIIALQIIFAVIIGITVTISFDYLYKDILQTLLQSIVQSVQTHHTVTSQSIFDSIQVVKSNNFFSFFTITLFVTLLFSYIIAKITLTPTRNALKSQKRFIGDIAHELRTPLSIIKTNTEVALLDDTIDPQTKSIFTSNIEELDRMSEIINNLLSLSNLTKLENMEFKHVDIGHIIDSSVKKLSELAGSKNILVTVRKTPPSGVWGNTTALEQITTNLLKNAINYTADGGQVTVQIQPDYRGSIILSVADNGIGIPSKDLSHIFEPFYRSENSRNRKSGGSGLGLTIVHELIKLHGGSIDVNSRIHKGTTVVVTLPYSPDPAHAKSEKE